MFNQLERSPCKARTMNSVVTSAIALTLCAIATTQTGSAPVSMSQVHAGIPTNTGTSQLADWQWPTTGPKRPARPFEAPPTVYSKGHRGIDIKLSDANVRASADGVVSFSGKVAGRGVLTITYSGGLKASIEPVSSELSKGESVARGEIVARFSGTHAGCPGCIHFGVRLHDEYVNPMRCFGPLEWSVLVPNY